MGIPYVLDRSLYSLKQKSGSLKHTLNITPVSSFPLTGNSWVNNRGQFLFQDKTALTGLQAPTETLKNKASAIFSGKLPYFNYHYFDIPETNRWHVHPLTGYHYPNNIYYFNINDFAEEQDIKYVWEASRFCYIYDIIRYDYHFQENQFDFIFKEITSWIHNNPLNYGPNYMSGQEVAIRVLNWCFCINYYANEIANNETLWQEVMSSVYEQLKHIEANLFFSQKFVRNNHLISEATCLFVYSLLFPALPESAKWQNKSKQILEQEAQFQIFNDGSYLQYSMNYHRVIIQLYNWVIKIGNLNKVKFSDAFISQIKKSLQFLVQNTDPLSGYTPNYGANDGSLIFPLNDNDYRDFRPQLQSLAHTLHLNLYEEIFEDTCWVNNKSDFNFSETLQQQKINQFPTGGYYNFSDAETFTFIRCGSHIRRPSQADNLHLDLWYQSQNIMRDGGTYVYNGESSVRQYFFGTQSHNTIKIGNYDQMLKGSRFIWYYWSKLITADLIETDEAFIFNGSIKAFALKGKWATHSRKVIKQKKSVAWEVTDSVSNHNNLPITQIWNPGPQFKVQFDIDAIDANNNSITPVYEKGYFSNTYGHIEEIQQILFRTNSNTITTRITLK